MPVQAWDHKLKSDLINGILSGYALLTHQQTVQCAYGCLEDELTGEDANFPLIKQLTLGFTNTKGSPSTTSLNLCGQQTIIVNSNDASYLAVSQGNGFAVAAQYLPIGIVVVTCDGRRTNPTALPTVLTNLASLASREPVIWPKI